MASTRRELRDSNHHRQWAWIVAVLAVSFALSACGSGASSGGEAAGEGGGAAETNGSSEEAGSSEEGGGSSEGASPAGGEAAVPSGEVKMGAVLFGTRNDESFNQATYEGIEEQLKEFSNLKLTSTLENRISNEQATDALTTVGALDNVIVAASASYGPLLEEVAPNFPKTYFINIAGAPEKKIVPNVTGFLNDWGAPTYIAGIIAAHVTKTGVIGYVGGAQIPPTTQAEADFTAGAKSVNPKIKILNTITGSFEDLSAAKAATTAMIDENADVIFPFLDAGVAGSYQAGRESGKNPMMFKLTIPKCGAYPNIIGTEIVNDKVAASKLIAAYMHKTIKPGMILLDLQEPEVQTFELCPKYKANKELENLTETAIEEVNSGKRKLPADGINPRPKFAFSEGFGK